MNFQGAKRFFGVAIPAFLLIGCASQGPEYSESTENLIEETAVQEIYEPAAPRVEAGKLVVDSGDKSGASQTLVGVFLFDFDQAIVRRAGHAELNKHASALAGDRYLRLRLEGHADERGTREYNLALGERRADAVREYLVSQGASNSQIEVISYGEEKPIVSGKNESSWAKNRRVELVYR
ncbi:MAG: peptidoglycan-associated lipoprotein Pal [Pseudomonadota bacterium]|jgi:peptidoglycan-associated lipoprotein|nr:peptidoglycan-associated lipoprotein Pal [Pseudomonadota bacterium]